MDRQQSTVLNRNTASGVSEWQNVKQGVPQGSVLGPLLLLIHINDLPFIINSESKPILFADDTSILCCKTNFNKLNIALKEILESINTWFLKNLLTLYLNKTKSVQFLTKPSALTNLNINHGDILINNTNALKFLGLIIDSTLSWKEHIKYTASKLSSTCYAIRILTSILSLENLLMMYNAYVHSIMTMA
jgi:hypothetical protein